MNMSSSVFNKDSGANIKPLIRKNDEKRGKEVSQSVSVLDNLKQMMR